LLYVLPSNYSALTAIYTPSLHDALPISRSLRRNPFDFEIILVGLGQLVRRSETPLVEQFRVDIADSGNRVERSARVTCLFFGFGITAHVELPARQPMSQADVLAALADRERELIVR